MRPGLPFRVTVLIWVVLSLTVWNLLRLWTALTWRARLAEFAPVPGPLYTGLSGGFWVLAGLFVLGSLWKGFPWQRRVLLAGALLYALWYWADRLLFQAARPDWLFNAIVTTLLLLHVFYTLNSDYFRREAYERQP
jgi:hypothetical protein